MFYIIFHGTLFRTHALFTKQLDETLQPLPCSYIIIAILRPEFDDVIKYCNPTLVFLEII